MKEIKISNGHYLDDKFSSIDKISLWNKLVKYINDHSSSFSNVMYDKDDGVIKVIYKNEHEVLDIIKRIDVNDVLAKNIIRTVKINTCFDKLSKGLKLSSENVENFPQYNEIFYSITCNDNLSDNNSLFFHESSLINYINDFDIIKWNECIYRVAVLFYKVKKSIVYENSDIESTEYTENAFLCYNTQTKLLEIDIDDNILNKNKILNLNEFISSYNSNSFSNDLFKFIKNDSKNILMIDIFDVRLGITEFRMIDKKIDSFICFRSFSNSLIFDSFLESAFKKSLLVF